MFNSFFDPEFWKQSLLTPEANAVIDVASGQKGVDEAVGDYTKGYITGNLLDSGANAFGEAFGENPLASPEMSEMGNRGLDNYDVGMNNVKADINGFTATPDVSQGNYGTPQVPDYVGAINTSDPTKQMLTNGYADTFTNGVRDQATNQQPHMGLINPPDTAQASDDDDTFLGLTKGQYAQTALDAGVGALANQQPTVMPQPQVMPITQGQQIATNAINGGLGLISNDALLRKLRQGIA